MRKTKVQKIREFKKETEKRFGVKFYQIDFAQFKKLSNTMLDDFFSLLKEKIEDADTWGRHVESVYWSKKDEELGVAFYEYGDYSHQFMKTVTFSPLRGGEIENFSDFVIRGIRKGLFIDTSDLYL